MKSMWRRLRPLLQPEENPVANHSADEFAAFFTRKVENIRSSTASAPPTSDFQSSRLVSSPSRDHFSMRLDRGTGLIRAFIPPW